MPDTTVAALEKLVEHAGRLYSLPSVAMDVIRLTECESVDVPQLKETIERDPALCAKLLRVVNSSLFGLSGRVSDLNQALALLGVEPLKMLVLGFSLPDELFTTLAGKQLRRYWTTSLTRAVCARRLAELTPSVSGDQAFLAGLLRDLGELVMLQQIGEPYLRFLEHASEQPGRLLELEEHSLGFNHTHLSAELMRTWQLPPEIVEAVQRGSTSTNVPSDCPLREVLELAELVLQVVIDKRLEVFAELVERCEQMCGIGSDELKQLLEPLQTRVQQLSEAMSVELSEELDQRGVLAQAHALLAAAAENAVSMMLHAKTDDELAQEVLAESHDVRLAMREFLRGAHPERAAATRAEGAHPPRGVSKVTGAELTGSARNRLLAAVDKRAQECRDARAELSLVVVLGEVEEEDDTPLNEAVLQALEEAQAWSQPEHASVMQLDERRVAVLMPGVDRRTAVEYATAAAQQPAPESGLGLKAGVASITLVPNRFEADRLVSAALGCLSATLVSGSTRVKSIEVY